MDPAIQDQLERQWKSLTQERKSVVLDKSYHTAVHALIASGAITADLEEAIVLEVLMTIIDLQTLTELEDVLVNQHALTPTAAHAVVAETRKLIGAPTLKAAHGQSESTTPTPSGPCTPASVIADDAELTTRLERLPPEVQTAITSDERNSAFTEIITSLSLDEPRARLLCERVARVMLGMATTKDLEMLLNGGTVVNTGQAKGLQEKIENVMLSPVRKAIVTALESRKGTKGGAEKKPKADDPYREPVA